MHRTVILLGPAPVKKNQLTALLPFKACQTVRVHRGHVYPSQPNNLLHNMNGVSGDENPMTIILDCKGGWGAISRLHIILMTIFFFEINPLQSLGYR